MALKMRRLAGFTLTEIAIVLGVIGVLIGGVWTASSMVTNNRKSARAAAQILEISNNVRQMFAMRQSMITPVGVRDQSLLVRLIAMNAIPNDLPVVGSYPQNAWGGIMAVFPSVISADSFRISYYNIPVTACVKIATAVISSSGTTDANPFTLITNVGRNTVNLNTALVDPVVISSNCTINAAGGVQPSVEFDFKLTQ